MEAVAAMHAHGPGSFDGMQRSLAQCTALMKATALNPRS